MIEITCIKPVNEKYVRMRDVYNACVIANVEIPDEVKIYFEDKPPPEGDQQIEVNGYPAKLGGIENVMGGVKINLDLLPEDFRIIIVKIRRL